jgi:hypothetical protein
MTFPCIDIQRHDVGLYEWAIFYGTEKATGEAGNSSIQECLRDAALSLPEAERAAEVRYRGVHMGTFKKVDLIECHAEVADCISEAYGALA